MDEFGLIERYFKPLAAGFNGSLNLTDDAAILTPPPGHDLVITKDAISAGVHFIGDESPALIAKKLLRVNLSDLAAMGATPLVYFLAIMLPKDTQEEWLKSFAEGLAEDQKEFSVSLAGGDSISTQGTASFSITAIGTVPTGKAIKRANAKPGDSIYISGTLGDSALGLLSLKKKLNDAFLESRYLLPEPRIALGKKLHGIASACMDISDGLAQDIGHICKASGVGATIHCEKLPVSKSAANLVQDKMALWDTALTGGDDYELAFTVPQNQKLQLEALGFVLTEIGVITEGAGVRLLDENGSVISLSKQGFKHF